MVQEIFDPTTIEIVRNLVLADNLCFSSALDGKTDIIQKMGRTILGREDIIIDEVQTQRTITQVGDHSAVFDILARSSSGSLIDIEIQRSFCGWEDLSGRIKLYSSLLMLKSQDKGEPYSMSRESIIIFIMDRDVMKRGLPVYEYKVRNQLGEDLRDFGLTIVLANGEYRDNMESEISKLFSDLYEADPEKVKVPELKEIMKSMKEGNEPMTKVDAILSRVREESMASGMAKGMAEGMASGIAKGMAEGMAKGSANASIQHAKKLIELGMPYQQIAWVIDSSEEEVAEIAERMATAPLD